MSFLLYKDMTFQFNKRTLPTDAVCQVILDKKFWKGSICVVSPISYYLQKDMSSFKLT